MLKTLILGAVGFLGMTMSTTVCAQGNWQMGDAGSVRFRFGLFEPKADSTYWDEIFTVWTGEAENFRDLMWGIDGNWMFSPTSGLQLGSQWYSGNTQQAYREWVDADGNEITHNTELQTWDLTVAWIYRPRSRSVVRPYFGIGGGFSWWRLTESGRFIDFGGGGDLEVITTTYWDEGSALIGFVEAGIDILAWDRWAFFVEGRWKEGDASLGGDFSDLDQRLDLSGPSLSAGFALLF